MVKMIHISHYRKLRKKCPHFSRIFPLSDWIRRDTGYLLVFSPNAGKCGKNADQSNSEYWLFLLSGSNRVNVLYTDAATVSVQ